MKDVLRERQTNPNAENHGGRRRHGSSHQVTNAAAEPTLHRLQPHEKLDALAERSGPSICPGAGRPSTDEIGTAGHSNRYLETPTVSSLAPKLNEPARRELKQLRNDIKRQAE